MDAAERALFVAGVRHATENADGDALDADLDDLGWQDALRNDRAIAAAVLFENLGATASTSAALDALLAGALGVEADRTVVVLPRLRRTEPPGHLVDGRCRVQGLATAAFGRCDRALVVAETGATLTIDPSLLRTRKVEGLDPALGLFDVTGELDTSAAVQTAADWPAVLAVGQLALGHELVGAGRTMLGLARTHALERMQFGRPIGSFQAVRHRLADSLVALEAAASLLDAAWDDPTTVTAAMAKAFAGRSARTVARHCQQVLAGIGFTTEHPFHRYVRRIMALDQLLGAGSTLTRALGTGILTEGSLPVAFAL
jgi:hypothetical protein